MEMKMNGGKKDPLSFRYQSSDIVEHPPQKNSGEEEKIAVSDMKQF